MCLLFVFVPSAQDSGLGWNVITWEVFSDHLIQNLPHPVSPSWSFVGLKCFSWSTVIVCVHLLIYCFILSISSARRTASASSQYSVVVEWKVFWKSWQSPESTSALLLSGSSLIWSIVTTPLHFWQRVEHWLEIPGQRENRQIRTLYCFLLALQIWLVGLVILLFWLNTRYSTKFMVIFLYSLGQSPSSHSWWSMTLLRVFIAHGVVIALRFVELTKAGWVTTSENVCHGVQGRLNVAYLFRI